MAGLANGLPFNPVTKKYYQGGNILTLAVTSEDRGYFTNDFASYNQWGSIGVHVNRGEKAAYIVFYKTIDEEAEAGKEVTRRAFARTSAVFNAAQTDWKEQDIPQRPALEERLVIAEQYIRNTKVEIRHGGNSAFYQYNHDFIQLPHRAQFTSDEAYFAVTAHELTHATGHASRLNREFGKRRDDPQYFREELIAEMGAAFLCAKLGVTNEVRADHAIYLRHYLDLLKADNKAIFVAASAAQKAAEWCDSVQPAWFDHPTKPNAAVTLNGKVIEP